MQGQGRFSNLFGHFSPLTLGWNRICLNLCWYSFSQIEPHFDHSDHGLITQSVSMLYELMCSWCWDLLLQDFLHFFRFISLDGQRTPPFWGCSWGKTFPLKWLIVQRGLLLTSIDLCFILYPWPQTPFVALHELQLLHGDTWQLTFKSVGWILPSKCLGDFCPALAKIK